MSPNPDGMGGFHEGPGDNWGYTYSKAIGRSFQNDMIRPEHNAHQYCIIQRYVILQVDL